MSNKRKIDRYKIVQTTVTAKALAEARGGIMDGPDEPGPANPLLFVRCPVSYDPATITAEDIIHDAGITVTDEDVAVLLRDAGITVTNQE